MSKSDNPNQNNFVKQFDELQKIISQSGPVAAASYSLIVSILIFTYLGWYIDKSNQSAPFGILIGLCFGLLAGFYYLFKIIYRRK